MAPDDALLDEDSLRRLRCPVTLARLRQADNELIERVNRTIEARGAPTRGGQPHTAPLQGGLVTEDGKYLYPIQDGIVCMLAESAVELSCVDDPSRQRGDATAADPAAEPNVNRTRNLP